MQKPKKPYAITKKINEESTEITAVVIKNLHDALGETVNPLALAWAFSVLLVSTIDTTLSGEPEDEKLELLQRMVGLAYHLSRVPKPKAAPPKDEDK